MKHIISAILALMFGAVVSAQQRPAPAQPTSLDFKQPTASPEFSKFRDRVLGTWKAIEIHEKRRSLPEGGSGEGTVTFTAGPGGLSVLENYRSKNPWGDFANHSVFWWDAEAGGMKSVGCETVHPECEVSEGVYKWEGDDLVARGERSGKMPNGKPSPRNLRSGTHSAPLNSRTRAAYRSTALPCVPGRQCDTCVVIKGIYGDGHRSYSE